MKSRHKQYMVLGLGRFGASVATTLFSLGNEVLAIDSDAENVNDIATHVTQAMQMDATDETALASLGVRNFDAAIVCIGENLRDSILVCVLLKEMGVRKLVAKATDDLHAKVLTKIGVDRVIFPERDMGQRIAHSLYMPGILDLMTLNGDYRLIDVLTPEGWLGRSIAQIDVRRKYGLTIIAIHRGKEYVVSPTPDETFAKGDSLLVLGREADIERLEA